MGDGKGPPGAGGRPTGASGAAERRPLRRYTAVYGSAAVGLVAGAVAALWAPQTALEIGVGTFFLLYLVIVIFRLVRLSTKSLRAHAEESDLPGYVILAIALLLLAAAAASLFLLLNGDGRPDGLRVAFGIMILVLGWLGVHTMLGLHYAYEYYDTDAASPPGKDGRRPHVGGLDFPGGELPDALSFLYFSFVIGMTAQVSDVTVTSNAMRRIVLVHGILAFFFNTVILATAINVVVSLGH